ncbi:hypothetical protein Smic_43130 [Streptomyces microflavus]|uniref:Uncharacterized protein n=1 Tax=Streptomyces microflavus TaxID=1919 RepID=A0A7J0CVH8_STRMI|nr:hypothetical protein Smic_43130 [Streptomyces microflavus]
MHMTESPRPSGAYTTDQDPTPYPYDTAYSTAYDGAAGGYPPPPPYAPDPSSYASEPPAPGTATAGRSGRLPCWRRSPSPRP